MKFEFTPEQRKDILTGESDHIKAKIDAIQNMDSEDIEKKISEIQKELADMKQEVKNLSDTSEVSLVGMSEKKKEDFVFLMQKRSVLHHELKELQELREVGTDVATSKLLDKFNENSKKLKGLE